MGFTPCRFFGRAVSLCAGASAALALAFAPGAAANVSVIHYDNFQAPHGYTSTDYAKKWSMTFGPLELGPGHDGTQSFGPAGETVSSVPFDIGADFSVFDHLKYIAISNQSFSVPHTGSVSFGVDMTGSTPGTVQGLVQQGVYGPPGAWTDPLSPPFPPNYSAPVKEGQQAGVVLNMIDFCTGQLFDWFLSSHSAFTLIERLPSTVSGNTSSPNCPNATNVGLDKMYTQIINEVPIRPGVRHHFEITFSRGGAPGSRWSSVDYTLDGHVVSHVDHVGIPLDKQGVPWSGTYPSLGPGEDLTDQIQSFSIGHGLFSVIDAFPFQYDPSGSTSVSIPVGSGNPADAGRARLFGQGAIGTWDNFDVTTKTN